MLRIYNLEKLLQQIGVFVGPGPAAVVEHALRDRKGDSVLCNSNHKYVYWRLTEVPLGSVQNCQIRRAGRNEIQQKPPKCLVAKGKISENRWRRR